jgi:hypothetical protein
LPVIDSAPAAARQASQEWDDLQGSLRLFYLVWRAARAGPQESASTSRTLKEIAKEAAGRYGSVSQFGTQAVAPLLEQRGLCVKISSTYAITPAGKKEQIELEQRIATRLRSGLDTGSDKQISASAVLMQALFAVSVEHRSARSGLLEIEGKSDIDEYRSARETPATPAYGDSSAFWALHWSDIDRDVDSAGGDGGWGDGGDGGGDGGGGDGGGGD